MSSYVTTNGSKSLRELIFHYVSICKQIEVLDGVIFRCTVHLERSMAGQAIEAPLIHTLLDMNEKAWTRRTHLESIRAAAHAALLDRCEGNLASVDTHVSQIAAQYPALVTQ